MGGDLFIVVFFCDYMVSFVSGVCLVVVFIKGGGAITPSRGFKEWGRRTTLGVRLL